MEKRVVPKYTGNLKTQTNTFSIIPMTFGKKKTDLTMGTFELSRSFNHHHSSYKDTFLKYIQFRTLNKRLYTNKQLFKICNKPYSL